MAQTWKESRDRLHALAAIAAIASFLLACGNNAAATGERQASRSSGAAKAAFEQAQKDLSGGDLNSALEDVRKGLHDVPTSVGGLNLMGIILARQGKEDEARRAFEAALKVNPHSVETLNNLGRFYTALKHMESAEKEFRAALKEDSSNRDANYNLGVVLLARGRPQDAIRYFLKINPPDVDTLFNLTDAFFSAGQVEEGLRTAKLLSQQGKNDVRVHFSLGVLLAARKQYKAAESELEAADALAPGTYEILYNLGEAYLRDGKDGKADLTLRRAIRIRPDSAEALFFLAQAQTDQGNDVDALNTLIRAHHLAPKNTNIIFLMARLSMKQSYFEDAIPLLEEGLKTAPERADLHAALGECYFTVGKIDKAFQQFQALVKLAPTAPSYAFMGLYYRHQGRFEDARKYFELGLAQDPKNAACLYNMGFIASRQGHYSEAEGWLAKALAVDPNYVDALSALASVKMSERKYAEAIPLLRKCTALSRQPAPEYYKLMTAERDLHDMDAAERDLKIFQTLSKNPKSGPYPFQHLFDYLNKLEGLPSQERKEVDVDELLAEVKRHPDQPRNFYMLAQAYLKLGQRDEAEQAIAHLDQMSGGDARTSAGVGVLLARYDLYGEAIRHFEMSLHADPSSDDVRYDLAVAYFRIHQYEEALNALKQISPAGQKEDSVLALLADTDAHLGRFSGAIQIYAKAIKNSPDNDQNYLSLSLAQMQSGQMQQARETLMTGLGRIPDSGKLFWGMGVLVAAEGNAEQAEQYLKKSVDLLPEWPGSYSALGILYYQTGQIDKAQETLRQVSQNGLQSAFDVKKIEQVLTAANNHEDRKPNATSLNAESRRQFLQLALALADQTL